MCGRRQSEKETDDRNRKRNKQTHTESAMKIFSLLFTYLSFLYDGLKKFHNISILMSWLTYLTQSVVIWITEVPRGIDINGFSTFFFFSFFLSLILGLFMNIFLGVLYSLFR